MTEERVYYQMGGTTFAWHAFGRILIAGFFDDPKDPLVGEPVVNPVGKALVRTGPFVPPVSFPIGHCVVTDSFRKELESSGLRGLAFAPVLKHHIVELHWEEWDRTKELEPWQLPESGLEGYFLDHAHSPQAAAAMGHLWELCPPRLARITNDRPRLDLATARRMFKDMVGKPISELPRYVEPVVTYYLVREWSAVGDHDFFRASPPPPNPLGSEGSPRIFVSERAKDWLEAHVGEWVDFEELKIQE
ncbi:MAG: hypothetical protein WD468_05180 [Pirellulales bacterium]